ncbi:MAG: O-antigen ligase family protein [Woeseia sp.]
MTLSSAILAQLTVIVLFATVIFFVAYRLPQVISSSALLIIIPIQPVDTRFASANVFLTYVIFLAMLLRGENIRLPLLPHFLVLLLCYFISMSFVHRALYLQHGVYMIAVISGYMVLCLAHELTMRLQHPGEIVNIFFAMNIVVIIYCAIQMAAGPGVKVIPFGIDEMTMIPGRDDNRLTGPFAATGVTSEFFVILILLLVYRLLITQGIWLRIGIILLAGINLAFLVATGNRGGFLSLIGGAALFLWLLRKELGFRRVLQLTTMGIVLVSIASAIIVNYSEFGRLFTRLEATTLEEGIPDTRQQAWPQAWERIKERPIFGHGPRLMMEGGEDGMEYPGWEYMQYPHSLYLFLLATVGIVGSIAFLIFLLTPMARCWRARLTPNVSVEDRAFIKTGIVIFVVVMVDQIKVEFMRINLVDYWHFIFALLGVFVAACDRARAEAKVHAFAKANRNRACEA